MTEEVLNFLSAQARNEFFAGGVALGTVGILMAFLCRTFIRLAFFIKHRFVSTMDIDSRCDAFEWFVQWLGEQPYSHICMRFKAETINDQCGETKLLLIPTDGFHFFWHSGRLIWLYRETDKEMRESGARSVEKFSISCFSIDRLPLAKIIIQAKNDHGYANDGFARVLKFNWHLGRWRPSDKHPYRTLDSIYLPENCAFNITSDIEKFLSSKSWYRDRHIPWRRGYLFFGLPGTGKTSTITAIASELGLDICLINLNDGELSDRAVHEMMSSAPKGSLMLMEDIDCLFVGRANKGSETNITFSGFLNALDGVAAHEGHVVFMTTNHIDKLDPALIRPGRIDVRVEFTYATREQAKEMFTRFYPGEEDLSHKFSNSLGNIRTTTASIQTLFLQYPDSPVGAINNIQKLKLSQHEDTMESVNIYRESIHLSVKEGGSADSYHS